MSGPYSAESYVQSYLRSYSTKMAASVTEPTACPSTMTTSVPLSRCTVTTESLTKALDVSGVPMLRYSRRSRQIPHTGRG